MRLPLVCTGGSVTQCDARATVTFPATEHRFMTVIKLYYLVRQAHVCELVAEVKSSVKILDGCIQRAIGKIFSVYDNDNITSIRIMCDIPPTGINVLLFYYYMYNYYCAAFLRIKIYTCILDDSESTAVEPATT